MSKGTVIARGGLNLRRHPGAGRVLKALRRGTGVEILGRETWLRVRTRDGREGWVLSDYVETDPEDLFPPDDAEAAETQPAVATTRDPVPSPHDATAQPRAFAPVCDIRPYRNERFIGNELHADHDFFPDLDRLNAFAAQCDIELFVTSSTRELRRTVHGAITPPATRSNHLVGHAIDVNVKSASGFFNSRSLRRANLSSLPEEVQAFIHRVREDPELRWGGDFRREDPVHIDNGLNGRDPRLWDSKLASRT